MKYVIVGGSAGLGRALGAELAAAGHDLIVVASGTRDIEATATDLSIRYGRVVVAVAADVTDREGYLASLRAAVADAGDVDGVFFPVGAVRAADDGTLEPEAADWLTRVNFSCVAWTVAALLPQLQTRPQACIVGFGSIAAIRGRSRNVVYAAAKRALVSYFESLRHRCAGTNITVQLYIVGYLDTTQAFGRPTLLPRANPAGLSRRVLQNLSRDVGTVYYPAPWRWVSLALWLLPWPVFRRLSF